MKKSIIIVLLICLVAGVFTGCTSKGVYNDSDLTKIVISEMRGESWIPVYAAEMLGYFKEEGLDTEWVVLKMGQ